MLNTLSKETSVTTEKARNILLGVCQFWTNAFVLRMVFKETFVIAFGYVLYNSVSLRILLIALIVLVYERKNLTFLFFEL